MKITDKDRLDFMEKNGFDLLGTNFELYQIGWLKVNHDWDFDHKGSAQTLREAIDNAIKAIGEKDVLPRM